MSYLKFKEWIFSEEFKNLYKKLPKGLRKVARHQLTRLPSGGEGNHFLEVQKDENNNIWIMFHFGSRNLGQQVGKYYNTKAKELNKMWYSSISEKHDLAFLPLETDVGKDYINAMNLCLNYARFNHSIAGEHVKNIFKSRFDCNILEEHYVTHNYATVEHHFGQNVMVHRKGATLAREDTIGIIPGSQGTCSYIVKGKGNKESFNSCSHGAGRKMGRKEAVRTLDFELEKKLLDDKGIIHAIRNKEDLEEASGAYKDISVVMSNQSDLVDIIHRLEPLAVIKG